MQTTAYSINFDSGGDVTSVTIDGEEAKECSEAPREDVTRIVASYGKDPENGDGIQIIEYASIRCVHFFCRYYCY